MPLIFISFLVIYHSRHLATAKIKFCHVQWDLDLGIVVAILIYQYQCFQKFIIMHSDLLLKSFEETNISFFYNLMALVDNTFVLMGTQRKKTFLIEINDT